MTKDHVTKGKEFLTYIIFYHIFLIIFFFIFWRLGQMWYKPPGPQKMRTREIQWLAISHTCVFPIHTQYLASVSIPGQLRETASSILLSGGGNSSSKSWSCSPSSLVLWALRSFEDIFWLLVWGSPQPCNAYAPSLLVSETLNISLFPIQNPLVN